MSSTARGPTLDPACPIEWGHPLNRGLLSDWTPGPLPGWSGGLTIRDLVRGGRTPHDVTLTNGPTWAGGPTPGSKSVLYDGSNDYGGLGTALAPFVTGPFAIEMWLKPVAWPTSTGQYAGLIAKRSGFSTLAWEWYYNNPSDAVSQGTNDGLSWGSGNSLSNGTIGFGVKPALAVWSHIVLTRSGDVYTVYLNGVSAATQTRSGTVPGGTDQVVLGVLGSELVGTAAFHYSGSIGSARVYDGRALSDAQVGALYQQRRRGSPDLYRWLRPWSFGVTVEAIAPTRVLLQNDSDMLLQGDGCVLAQSA